MNQPFLRRTWIDIDLDKLAANYRTACSLTDATVTCVVKSNAYGHGAVRIAQHLQKQGCRSFAVSCAREGIELRLNGIEGEILVMGLTEPDILPQCMASRLTLTAGSISDLQAMDSAAAEAGITAVIHLKLDTGFHRLGFDCTEENAAAIAEALRQLPHLQVQGVYGHLGLITKERDEKQHEALVWMHEALARHGVSVPEMHLCDSIGLVRYPQWHHSRVRVGAILFGVRPYGSDHMPFSCYETLTFHTTVSRVHTAHAGDMVGYTEDHVLDRDTRIATLCMGYGDGYPRHLSNGLGWVSIRGKRAPVVGLICMDQMMVDVTDIPDVKAGDTVDLIGGGIPYMDYADMARTNRNECITILSRRPVRVYYEGGKIVTADDALVGGRSDY
ncbi:MAG: alanine racemase [Clostridia bacterium]|nr:alanine racemase [Clostridia bacterium]